MQDPEGSSTRPAIGDVAVYLLAVAAMAASLTIVFLSMRAVMDIGGYCAEGGPYVIQTHCPEGVPLLLILSIFGLFLFGGLIAWRGARLGGSFDGLVILAWPALFLSLGWNFLEYGSHPPGDDSGLVWSWLLCGVLFVVMGAVPLVGMLLPGVVPAAVGSRMLYRPPSPSHTAQLRDLRRSLDAALASKQAWTDDDADLGGRPATATTEDDLVSRLERLAALRRAGSLSSAEFEAAKLRLIEGDER